MLLKLLIIKTTYIDRVSRVKQSKLIACDKFCFSNRVIEINRFYIRIIAILIKLIFTYKEDN